MHVKIKIFMTQAWTQNDRQYLARYGYFLSPLTHTHTVHGLLKLQYSYYVQRNKRAKKSTTLLKNLAWIATAKSFGFIP